MAKLHSAALGSFAVAAVPQPFLHSSLINIKNATAIPNLTAVNNFLAEFMRFRERFQKVAPSPPPPLQFSTIYHPHALYIQSSCAIKNKIKNHNLTINFIFIGIMIIKQYKKCSDLVSLMLLRVSSYFHTSFSSIYSPCLGL